MSFRPSTYLSVATFISGVWEDQDERAWDEPESIVLNKKKHECTDDMGCGCPMLLCTGETSCKRLVENPIKCQLTKPYEDIDLQKAKIAFFGSGDCKCNPLKLKKTKMG